MNISIADPLGNGTLVNITADKNYYVTIAGRNSAHNYVPKNVDHGYSSGMKKKTQYFRNVLLQEI